MPDVHGLAIHTMADVGLILLTQCSDIAHNVLVTNTELLAECCVSLKMFGYVSVSAAYLHW